MPDVSKIVGVEVGDISKVTGAEIGDITKLGGQTVSTFSNTYSMDFDGSNESITTGLDCSSATHPNLSVSYWMKSSSAPGLSFPVGVLAAGSNGRYISLGLLNGGTLGYKANNGWVSGGSVTDGNWHNIVWTFEWDTPLSGNMTCNVYLDGNTTPVISAVDLGAGGSRNLVGNLFIGSLDPDHTIPAHFPGSVDEVAVWNSALTTPDVTTIYNLGTPANLSSLSPLGWWRMGDDASWDGSDWTLTDQGSGGNDGTSDNMEEADRKEDVAS